MLLKFTGHPTTEDGYLVHKAEERCLPIGNCIYCDKTEAEAGKLTREHDVPAGMAGYMVLPDACCRSCQQIIGKFERDMMKRQYATMRHALGITSSHKRPKQTHHSLFIDPKTDKPVEHEFNDYAIATFPRVGMTNFLNPNHSDQYILQHYTLLPSHTPRQIYEQVIKMSEGEGQLVNLADGKPVDLESIPEENAEGWELKEIKTFFNPRFFFRWLSKIAHCHATYELGADGFHPELRDSILKDADDKYLYYIGSEDTDNTSGGPFRVHLSGLGQPGGQLTDHVIVSIQLFPVCRSPRYHVYCGMMTEIGRRRAPIELFGRFADGASPVFDLGLT